MVKITQKSTGLTAVSGSTGKSGKVTITKREPDAAQKAAQEAAYRNMVARNKPAAKKQDPLLAAMLAGVRPNEVPKTVRTAAQNTAKPQRISGTAALEEQRRRAAADLDMATVDRIDRQLKEMRAAAGRQTVGDRASDALSSAMNATASGFTNLLGLATNVGEDSEYNRRQIARMQADLAAGRYSDGTPVTPEKRKITEAAIAKLQKESAKFDAGGGVTNRIYRAADRMGEAGQQYNQSAKEGLGKLGQLAVDVGIAGAQMLGDAAIGGLPAMFLRSAGSSAQEARQSGASYGQQLAYGLGSGALSVATEKISNVAAPFRKVFGKGVLDEAIAKVTGRLGQSAVGKMALSALGEGGEEFIEDVFQPVLQRATYDPQASFNLEDALYDAAIGAVLGGIGGGVDAVAAGRARNASPAAAGTGAQTEQGSFIPGVKSGAESVLDAKKAAPGVEAAEPVRVGRVTTIKSPYQGVTPVQTQKSASTVSVDSGSVNVAQKRINGARGLEGAMPGKGFKSTLKEVYKSVFKAARGVPVDGVTFDGKPYTVDINSNVPGKVISDPNLTAEKLSLLDILPQVVQSGEYVGSGAYVQHSKTPKKTVRYDYFETQVTINGHTYVAAFDVEVEPNVNNYRTHKLIKIDLKETAGPDVGPAPTATATPSSPVEGALPLNLDSTIPQGADNVNSSDQDGNDGVGARTSQFPREQKVSEAKNVYEQADNATDADRSYDATSNQERMVSARERLEVDYDGEVQYLKDTPEWSGEDYAVAKLVQSDLRKQAVESGDFTEFRAWSRDIQKHASFFGQDLQSLKMWVEWSADKSVSDAAEVLEKAKEAGDGAPVRARKAVTDEVINDALGDIAKYGAQAERLSSAEDADGLYNLAVELANYRGYKPSKTLQKILKSCTAEELSDVVWSEISGISIDAIPPSVGQYVSTYQYLSHLLNAKTLLRNVVANSVFSPIESAFTNNIAAIVDGVTSAAVGEYQGISAKQARTVGFEKGPLSKAGWKGGAEAAKQSVVDVALDINRGTSRNKYEVGTNRTFKRHQTGNALADIIINSLNSAEGVLGYGLNTTDEFQKGGTAAKVRESMDGIIGTDGTRVTPEMVDRFVENEQGYRSFQRETFIGEKLQSVKNLLNVFGVGTQNGKTAQVGRYRFAVKDFGLGDFVAKYTRVPGALVTTVAEYTDLGCAKALYNLGAMAYTNRQVKIGRGDAKVNSRSGVYANMTNAEASVYSQRAFAQNIARVLTGKGIVLACSALAKMGVLVFTDDDDKDEASIKSAMGLSGLQINLSALERLLDGKDSDLKDGDVLLDTSSLEPVNGLMEMGARMYELEDDAGYSEKMDIIADTLINSFTDLSMMQNAKTVQNAVTYKSEDETWGDVGKDIALGVLGSGASGFIPGPVRQSANYIDDYYRDTASDTQAGNLVNSVLSAIPGAREKLPERVTPLGDDRKKTTDGGLDVFSSFVSPFNISKYQQSNAVDAMDQAGVYPARSAPKEVSADGKTVQLNTEQKRQYQKDSGAALITTVNGLLASGGYKHAGKDQQKSMLENAREYAKGVAKAKLLGNDAVDGWIEDAMEAQKNGISPAEFLLYKEATGGLEADKDANGKSITGSKKEKVTAAIAELDGFSPTEKDWLYLLSYDGKNAKKDLRKAPWNK